MKHLFRFLAISIILSGIVSCSGDGYSNPNPTPNLITFYATLNGASEVPINTSTATGNATLIFNNTTKIFTITVRHNVVGTTAGHIHVGAATTAPPNNIVFPLTSLVSPLTYTSPVLTTAQEADLKAGLYYVNLHSTAFPGGEIRGQLSIDPGPSITLKAILNGTNEVPSNTSTAAGNATLTFNLTTKIFVITVIHNVVGATAGHIHVGAAGTAPANNIVFPLTGLTSPITYTSPPLTTAQEADLKEGRYYVNLHTTAFPGGEIRGQFDNLACEGCWDY
jgi:hypothetical protein